VDGIIEEYINILLTHKGIDALSSQVSNLSNPWFTSTQWTSLSSLVDGEWRNKVPYPRVASKRAHLTKLLPLWESDFTGAKERWDLAALH
jgi:hypothetical protein